MPIHPIISRFLRDQARKGGLAKSPQKKRAVTLNLISARKVKAAKLAAKKS